MPTQTLRGREPLGERVAKGQYIIAYNDCNERRVIHDSGELALELQEDILFNKRQDLKVLVMKCEDLLTYFRRKVMITKGRTHDRISKDGKISRDLDNLIGCIYDELDYNNENDYEHFIYRYEEFKDSIKRHSTSFRDLNRT